MQFAKRTLLILITFWLFLCQTGMAWTVSTCLITGQKKVSLGKAAICCKMPNKSNEGGFWAKISKKPCCKIEQHSVKLSSASERLNFDKKIFQSFIKKLIFFELFSEKSQFKPVIFLKNLHFTLIKPGQYLLKLFQIFRI